MLTEKYVRLLQLKENKYEVCDSQGLYLNRSMPDHAVADVRTCLSL